MKRNAIICVLFMLVASLPAVNHMDLLTRIDGEFDGSLMGHTVVSLDYNGDGHQDLVASAMMWNPTGVYQLGQKWGKLYFYMGGLNFDNNPEYTIPSQWNGQYWGFLDNAGDVNGDGKEDFLMFTYHRAIPGETGTYFSLYVFYGRDVPTGQPDYVYNAAYDDGRISELSATPLGDINNDGYDDLGLKIETFTRSHQEVSVILGSSTGLSTHIPFRAYHDQNNYLLLNGIGDVNADGIDDFHLLYNGNTGKRFTVFYGDSSFPEVDSLVVCDNLHDVAMHEACPVGDVNGDSIADFVLSWGDSGKLWFGSTNLSSNWDATMDVSYFGSGTMPFLKHGDFNNDGIEDIVGSDFNYSYWNGRVGIWLGHQQFNGTVDLILNYPQYQSMQFGWAKAAGDFNADGYCDLAVSTPYFYGGATAIPGYVYIYSGNAQLIDTTVDVEDEVLPQPQGNIWNLKPYPNPFRGGKLHIEIDKAENISPNPDHISLYNLKGQLLEKRNLDKSDWEDKLLELALPDMPNGVYLLKLSDRKGHSTSTKIVVSH